MKEHTIVERVYAAKGNLDTADALIKEYLPFIKAETAKFIKRPPREGEDDELCIAMFAFHQAVMEYSRIRGSFLKFAAVAIRNRLIDYYRKEQRHTNIISLNQPTDEEEETSLMDMIESGTNEVEEMHVRKATKEEIQEFAMQLTEFGLSLEDIAENCPRQERTLDACHKALGYAKRNVELLDTLVSTKKLPIGKLASGSGVSLKTLERHRKYMVAIMLAYTNGYEIIRGHLCQISPQKEVVNR